MMTIPSIQSKYKPAHAGMQPEIAGIQVKSRGFKGGKTQIRAHPGFVHYRDCAEYMLDNTELYRQRMKNIMIG